MPQLAPVLGVVMSLASLLACTPTPIGQPRPLPTAPLAPGGAIGVHDVQGRGHRSPLTGQTVGGLRGIVTARRSTGFWVQDPTPDDDTATSEGIFVATPRVSEVKRGDLVVITGTVAEVRPGSGDAQAANLTVTQLGDPQLQVEVIAHDQALPVPVVIGLGDRLPPTAIIEDDAPGGDAEAGGTFDPDQDGLDFYESLEGMLVQVNDAVVVGPTSRFGGDRPSAEVYVLADNGTGAGLRTARGGIVVRADDFNPERLIFTNLLVDMPTLNVGDRFSAPVTGVLDYSAGKYQIHGIQAYQTRSGGLEREVAAPAGPDQLSIACFNVQNLDPGDPPDRITRLAGLIVTNLHAPDLLSVQEIQDNNGATADTETDASRTYRVLIAAIRAAGGPVYQYRDIAPVAGQDGGEPGGNIRVAFLFRPDRGLAFVDRPGGDARKSVEVIRNSAGSPELTFSPGRIEPGNPAFRNSRKPLAGEFRWKGSALFVIANHFTSKGPDEPLFGRHQPPVLRSEANRTEQARVINRFVGEIERLDKDANVVVLGDLNDYEFSPPIRALKGSGQLVALAERLPPNERYSYVYEGNSETLDQMLISPHLLSAAAPEYDVVHVNSEFSVHASDHDPSLVRLTLR